MNFAPFGKKSQHFDAGESLIIKGSGYCSVSNVEKETKSESEYNWSVQKELSSGKRQVGEEIETCNCIGVDVSKEMSSVMVNGVSLFQEVSHQKFQFKQAYCN